MDGSSLVGWPAELLAVVASAAVAPGCGDGFMDDSSVLGWPADLLALVAAVEENRKNEEIGKNLQFHPDWWPF